MPGYIYIYIPQYPVSDEVGNDTDCCDSYVGSDDRSYANGMCYFCEFVIIST